MATLEQLQAALVKADQAGNVEDARALANAIRQMQAQPARPASFGQALRENIGNEIRGGVGGGIVQGLRDAVDGGAQLLVRGARAVGLADDAEVGRVDNIATGTNRAYEQARAATGREGIDFARIGGNLLNPINRIVPMAGAGSTAAVAGRAALQGGISGLVQPVTEGENFAETKAQQVALGAGAGALGGAVADKAAGVVGNVARRVRGATQSVQQALSDADAAVSQTLAAQGFDLKQIPQPILDATRRQVADALRTGKALDPVAALRKAEADAILGPDAGLTLGQMTRDPMQFAREQNIRGIQNVGEDLTARFNAQNQRLIGAVDSLRAQGAPGAYSLGERVNNALMQADDAMSRRVNALYQEARGQAGADMELAGTGIAQRLGEIKQTFGLKTLPDAVRSQLAEYGFLSGKKTKSLTLNEIDQLVKTINQNTNPQNAPQMRALGQLKEAVIRELDTDAAQMAPAYRNALAAARERFSTIENTPALKAAIEGADPDRVLDKLLSSSTSANQLRRTTQLLDDESRSALQAQVADFLRSQALNGASPEVGVFSQSAFRRALDRIGDQKLAAIFGPEDAQRLRQISRVAESTQVAPAGSAVNRSNTASAAMNLLQAISGRVGQLPLLNIGVNSLRQFSDARAARNALAARPPATQISAEEIQALRPFFAPLGAGAGIAAAQSVQNR